MCVHKNCNYENLVYKDSEHVKEVLQDGNLGTLGEFCGAFYHVPKLPRTSEMVCLDPETCQVFKPLPGKEVDHCAQPKTAVAFVKYEIAGKPEILKRYTNCYDHQTHAEDFFKDDILKQIEERSLAVTATGLITMYITMQPCHKSTSGTGGTPEGYSCCEILKDLVNDLPNVKICIKPTHLCKAGWSHRNKSPVKIALINNAEEGLKILMCNERIEFSAMDADDWAYLWRHVSVPKDLKLEVGKERLALDGEIGEKLTSWKEEVERQAAEDLKKGKANQVTEGVDACTIGDQKGKKKIKKEKVEKVKKGK